MTRHKLLASGGRLLLASLLAGSLFAQPGSATVQHIAAPAAEAGSRADLPVEMLAAVQQPPAKGGPAGAPTSGPPEGLEAEDWEKISSRVREAEYRISRPGDQPDDESTPYQAFNRAQNLRTSFTETGIALQPAGDSKQVWDWGMSLAGYGYEGDIEPAGAAVLWAEGNRVEYRPPQLHHINPAVATTQRSPG